MEALTAGETMKDGTMTTAATPARLLGSLGVKAIRTTSPPWRNVNKLAFWSIEKVEAILIRYIEIQYKELC